MDQVGYADGVAVRGRKPVDRVSGLPLLHYTTRLPAPQVEFLRSLKHGAAAKFLREAIAQHPDFQAYEQAQGDPESGAPDRLRVLSEVLESLGADAGDVLSILRATGVTDDDLRSAYVREEKP